MREALSKVEKKDPIVPLIANVRAAPVTSATEIADLLVEQVTGQVRWRETVEWFGANGVTTLYEVGSGKVLTVLPVASTRTSTVWPSTARPISTRRLPHSTADRLNEQQGTRSCSI